MNNVVKLPNAVTRRAFARLPRRSDNGTPEERAAKRAQAKAEPSEAKASLPEATSPGRSPTAGDDADPHAWAFRDIEPRLNDCVRMAKIARQEAFDRYHGDNEELVFAIGHTAEMLEALKAEYYAAYHGEKPLEP